MKPLEDKIKKRLEDYESSLPEGDLAEFRELMDRAGYERRKVTPFRWIAPVAIAASVVLVVIFGRFPESEVVTGPNFGPTVAEIIEPSVPDNDNSANEVDITSKTGGKTARMYAHVVVPVTEEEPVIIPEDNTEEYQEEHQEEHDMSVSKGQTVLPDEGYYIHSEDKKSSINLGGKKPVSTKVGKAAASLLGGTGAVALASLLPSVSSGDIGSIPPYSSPVDGPEGSVITPAADERTGDASHSLPLRTGLSLRVPMNDRWSLTTGVDYSLYSSKIGYTVSGDKHQKVHYIGIPLRADYTLARNRWIDVYIGAGASADFCVAASEDGRSVPKDGIGLALIGGGGFQLNISKNLGIFVDPTFSLDVNPNNRSLETYKSDHPFMFSVSTGLRITFPTRK